MSQGCSPENKLLEWIPAEAAPPSKCDIPKTRPKRVVVEETTDVDPGNGVSTDDLEYRIESPRIVLRCPVDMAGPAVILERGWTFATFSFNSLPDFTEEQAYYVRTRINDRIEDYIRDGNVNVAIFTLELRLTQEQAEIAVATITETFKYLRDIARSEAESRLDCYWESDEVIVTCPPSPREVYEDVRYIGYYPTDVPILEENNSPALVRYGYFISYVSKEDATGKAREYADSILICSYLNDSFPLVCYGRARSTDFSQPMMVPRGWIRTYSSDTILSAIGAFDPVLFKCTFCSPTDDGTPEDFNPNNPISSVIPCDTAAENKIGSPLKTSLTNFGLIRLSRLLKAEEEEDTPVIKKKIQKVCNSRLFDRILRKGNSGTVEDDGLDSNCSDDDSFFIDGCRPPRTKREAEVGCLYGNQGWVGDCNYYFPDAGMSQVATEEVAPDGVWSAAVEPDTTFDEDTAEAAQEQFDRDKETVLASLKCAFGNVEKEGKCPPGMYRVRDVGGIEVPTVVPADTTYSFSSQTEADSKAQALADAAQTCFFENSRQVWNCPPNAIYNYSESPLLDEGDNIIYDDDGNATYLGQGFVETGVYTSTISQADADNLALAAAEANTECVPRITAAELEAAVLNVCAPFDVKLAPDADDTVQVCAGSVIETLTGTGDAVKETPASGVPVASLNVAPGDKIYIKVDIAANGTVIAANLHTSNVALPSTMYQPVVGNSVSVVGLMYYLLADIGAPTVAGGPVTINKYAAGNHIYYTPPLPRLRSTTPAGGSAGDKGYIPAKWDNDDNSYKLKHLNTAHGRLKITDGLEDIVIRGTQKDADLFFKYGVSAAASTPALQWKDGLMLIGETVTGESGDPETITVKIPECTDIGDPDRQIHVSDIGGVDGIVYEIRGNSKDGKLTYSEASDPSTLIEVLAWKDGLITTDADQNIPLPAPGGGAGGDLPTGTQGQMLYYDGVTDAWIPFGTPPAADNVNTVNILTHSGGAGGGVPSWVTKDLLEIKVCTPTGPATWKIIKWS